MLRPAALRALVPCSSDMRVGRPDSAPVVPREADTLGPGTNGQLAASYLTQEL